ncbi:MAG: hypothetical protein QGG48_05845, partial [Desulfatiglandales bacterium]|nr:hypothetical protein [Desulfatiglandales bacterium]
MNQKILYFHTTIWLNFFSDLLEHYQRESNSKVAIICDTLTKDAYRQNFDLGAEQIGIPDFQKKMDGENDEVQVRRVREIIKECENVSGKSIG